MDERHPLDLPTTQCSQCRRLRIALVEVHIRLINQTENLTFDKWLDRWIRRTLSLYKRLHREP